MRRDGERVRRRCIHMTYSEVLAYSGSPKGASALTHPASISKSSLDPNRRLYPRPSRCKRVQPSLPDRDELSHQNKLVHTQDNKLITPESNFGRGSDLWRESLNHNVCQIPDPWVPDRGHDHHMNICHSRSSHYSMASGGGGKQSPIPSGFGFVSARTILDPARGILGSPEKTPSCSGTVDKAASSASNSDSPSKRAPQHVWGVKRKRSAGCEQSNKMNSYFTAVSKPGSSAVCTVTSGVRGDTSVLSEGLRDSTNSRPRGESTGWDSQWCGSASQGTTSELIDLTQPSGLTIPSPSKPNAFTNLKQTKKLKRTDSKKKKKVSEPKFNRSNSFLYSGPPEKPASRQSVSDRYGLLGTGTTEFDDEVDYFSQLPLEVIENIFCRLPMMDLGLNLTRVCRDWNDLISQPKFLQWKKTYFRILRGDDDEKRRLVEIMAAEKMNISEINSILPGLIRYMKNYKPVTAPNMSGCLSKHPKYSWATHLISERLPDCIINEVAHPWCVITALVIISETVDDVRCILGNLVGSQSQCTATEVLECLYCIAAFLLVLKSLRYRDVWTGMHYRVYYALYLFENESSATYEQLREAFGNKSGQQSILKYGSGDSSVRYTHEQLRICNHNVTDGEILKIVAFAGTGKTTTLIGYTQLRPNLSFLLIVYNKSVQEHCASRFPVHVRCKTSHGLAMSNPIGRRYGHKIGNLRVSEVADTITPRKGMNLYVQAKFVIDTLTTFMSSADRSISLAHVPMESVDDRGNREFLGTEKREHLVEDAMLIWERCTNPRDTLMRIPHDGYLKLFQLSNPKFTGYDVILIDEAQDLSPAVIDILLQQSQPKILVGDPNQQIYSFRGAVNAMDMVTATTTYYLTQSFRFGSQIAFVANCCLELLKGEHQKVLVGNSSNGCVTGSQSGQIAIITRSNFTLFSEAVKKCCFSAEKVRVAFAGGVKAFGFDMIQDIYTLLLPSEDRAKGKHVINHALIRKFRSLPDLEKFATKTHDNELLGKIKIVKTYTHQLPSLVNRILERAVKDMTLADVVLSTTHKAKGLEFSTVRVTDDFVSNFSPAESRQNMAQGGVSADEYNLLYVAVTRAKKSLQMSSTLMRVLDYSGAGDPAGLPCFFWQEKFRYPRLSSGIDQQGSGMSCLLTDAEFTPCSLTLERIPYSIGGGEITAGGYYSPQVVLEDFPSLSSLYGALQDARVEGERRTVRVHQDARWEPHWLIAADFMVDEDDLDDFMM